MKKWWQHMNRGLLLLFVAVLAVSVYLLMDHEKTKKDKKAIIEITKEFISDSSAYFTCPDGFDFWGQEELTEESLSSLMAAQTAHVETYFCENEAVRNNQISYYFSFFENCRLNETLPANCTRVPLSIEVRDIYNGSATVVVTTQTTIEYTKEDDSRQTEVTTTEDTLLFLKQEGEWKLVSARSNMPQIEM